MEHQQQGDRQTSIEEIHKQNQENERKWEQNAWKESRTEVKDIGGYKDYTAGVLGVKELPDPQKRLELEKQDNAKEHNPETLSYEKTIEKVQKINEEAQEKIKIKSHKQDSLPEIQHKTDLTSKVLGKPQKLDQESKEVEKSSENSKTQDTHKAQDQTHEVNHKTAEVFDKKSPFKQPKKQEPPQIKEDTDFTSEIIGKPSKKQDSQIPQKDKEPTAEEIKKEKAEKEQKLNKQIKQIEEKNEKASERFHDQDFKETKKSQTYEIKEKTDLTSKVLNKPEKVEKQEAKIINKEEPKRNTEEKDEPKLKQEPLKKQQPSKPSAKLNNRPAEQKQQVSPVNIPKKQEIKKKQQKVSQPKKQIEKPSKKQDESIKEKVLFKPSQQQESSTPISQSTKQPKLSKEMEEFKNSLLNAEKSPKDPVFKKPISKPILPQIKSASDTSSLPNKHESSLTDEIFIPKPDSNPNHELLPLLVNFSPILLFIIIALLCKWCRSSKQGRHTVIGSFQMDEAEGELEAQREESTDAQLK